MSKTMSLGLYCPKTTIEGKREKAAKRGGLFKEEKEKNRERERERELKTKKPFETCLRLR